MSQQGRLQDIASAMETLTGNTGGAVTPDGSGNINIVGSTPYTVTGNPGTFTLTISDDGTLATTYTADSGSATPSSNNLNVLGDLTQGSVTSGAGSTLTITNSSASTSQKGVMEIATDAEALAGIVTDAAIVPSSLLAKLGAQTGNGIAYGNGTTAALGYMAALTNGQIAIGSTGLAPVPGTITSTGSTIDVTLGAGTINIETAATIATSYTTDAGSAVPALGVLTVTGGTLIGTTGAGSTVTINADDNVVGSVGSDSGTVTPASNAFSIVGTGGIATSGSGTTLTVDGSAISDFNWNEETGTSASMAVNNGYISNNAGTVTFTLPDTAALGDRVRVTGIQGTWSIAQNAGETIYFGTSSTTTGVGGSLTSTDSRDSIELVCVVANTDWNVLSSIGNITVV